MSNFDGTGSDLLPFLHAFCKSAADRPIRHKSEDKYLKVVNSLPKGRMVQSEIESGSHGFTSRLVDVEQGTETYQRQVTDAELLPLRNLFAIPLESDVGLFITERLGIRGLKSTLVAAIIKSFQIAHPGFILDINPLAPEEALKASLEEGEVKGIRLVRYGIPRDLEERYQLDAHEREVGTVELVLKPEKGLSFSKRRLSRLLQSPDRAGLLEVRGLDYHDIKVEVKVGKQTRTLTVTTEKTPRVTFLIPSDCDTDPAGRPTDDALYAFAVEVARDLGKDIGLDFERLLGSQFKWTEQALDRRVEVNDVEG